MHTVLIVLATLGLVAGVCAIKCICTLPHRAFGQLLKGCRVNGTSDMYGTCEVKNGACGIVYGWDNNLLGQTPIDYIFSCVEEEDLPTGESRYAESRQTGIFLVGHLNPYCEYNEAPFEQMPDEPWHYGRAYRHCCNETDFCNDNATQWALLVKTWPNKYGPPVTLPTNDALVAPRTAAENIQHWAKHFGLPVWLVIWMIVFVVVAVVSICVGLALVVSLRLGWFGMKVSGDVESLTESGSDGADGVPVFEFSGSGSGLPIKAQSTVAACIHIEKTIGAGRFGTVCLATWRGSPVAVKVFASRDTASWQRETEIYNTTMLRHDNLLGFIASDNRDTGTDTELWLIMEYHHMGSLFDYLNIRTINLLQLMTMMYSIANGLTHLHLELLGTGYQDKPSIAHRDIKSKNILVKRNGECAIADLGLAVRYDSATKKLDIPVNEKVGTVRYMAPAVLNGTLNDRSTFGAFMAADIYSCSLVMWEIVSCFHRAAESTTRHRLPYSDTMPSDPSVEEARAVVCTAGVRPELPQSDEILMASLHPLIKECWAPVDEARPTALCLKKKLARLSARCCGVQR